MLRLLIVDNDFSVRAGLRTYLNLAGYEVLEAGDAAAARELAAAHRPEAAIVDIALPSSSTMPFSQKEELCGLQLAAELKQTLPAIGLVFYSAYPEYRREVVDLVYTYHRGIVYKLKGCLPSALLAAVQTALEGGIWLDPEVTDSPSLADEFLERLDHDERPWVEQALSALPELTRQEREVARRLSAAQNTQGIAVALGITPGAVENYITRVYLKLGLHEIKSVAPQLRNIIILTKAWMIYDLRGGGSS